MSQDPKEAPAAEAPAKPPACVFTLIALLVILAVYAVLFVLFPNWWMPEIQVTLAFGWITYLWRVVPKLNPDPWTVGTAIFCLFGVVVGSHLFLRWLAGGKSQWPLRRTFRGVGLVVLMFVAGISVVGVIHQTSWLVRSPEPLVGSNLRAIGRTQSANNLKQISIAAQNHHDNTKPPEFPRSTFIPAGEPLHSWQTALLPYIEQDKLHKQIDHTKLWTHPANAKPMGEYVPTYMNPVPNDLKVNGLAASHFAGNIAVVLGDPKTLRSFPAGMSNTILAGEVSSNFRPWGDPLNARDPRGFGSVKGRPPQFVLLDGSVRTFDPQELAELLSKAIGVVGEVAW